MGTAVGDADGNGYPDFYCTNLSIGNVLLMNQGTGAYYDQTASAAVESNRLGWGTVFLDYDNDGWEDLYVCNHGSNRLYRNGASWPMTDVAPSLGVGTFGLLSHCVASADVDGDGDLDFAVEGYNQLLRLFINHEGDDQNWLALRLRSEGSNTHAIGARVEIVVDGLRQTRQVMAGVGLKSMSTTDLYFGLGASETVDLLTISWPDGRQTQRLDVPANQLLELWEPGGHRPGAPLQR